jgi:predicted membrane protein
MLLFIADTRITIWPFSITFARPWLAIGIILIMCGCICLKAQWYNDGLKRGAEIKEEVFDAIKKVKKTKIKEDI